MNDSTVTDRKSSWIPLLKILVPVGLFLVSALFSFGVFRQYPVVNFPFVNPFTLFTVGDYNQFHADCIDLMERKSSLDQWAKQIGTNEWIV